MVILNIYDEIKKFLSIEKKTKLIQIYRIILKETHEIFI